MRRLSTLRVSFLTGVALLGGGFFFLRAESGTPGLMAPLAPSLGPSAAAPGEPAPFDDEASCERDSLVVPTGLPVGLTCAQARSILHEVRERFAAELPAADSRAFVEGVTSWLDPHGLWSASSDAPTAPLIAAASGALLEEMLQGPHSDAPCAAALELGSALERWVGELGETFDAASRGAPSITRASATALATASAFEDGDVTVPARSLAAELGRRVGSVEQAFGASLEPFARASRERFVPRLAASEWQHAVLAAAVRAYVGVIDPHGAWAPLDEEWSLYADDPSFDDEDRLWGDMLRTALGVRVVDAPIAPLELDDLVLAIEGVPTAGLSVEQVEQLSRAESATHAVGERSLVVLRQGEDAPRELRVTFAPPEEQGPEVTDALPSSARSATLEDELAVDWVPYGRGNAAVVTIRYVGDDLGERLASIVTELLAARTPPVGILLDLRGNGGGSTDGAAAALGLFQPSVPAFPLLYRGRVMEVLVTPGPTPGAEWRGPVAALVDGATASAAEMLAGALRGYRRGPLLGQRTYGKGCVQEYFRDHAAAGVLRLTTRLYALPDGSSVQRQGLVPDVLVGRDLRGEHESDLPGSLEPSPGPDVRVAVAASPGWPPHGGRVGPCADSVVCQSLRRAAGNPIALARPEPATRKRRAPRPVGAATR